MIQVTLSDSYLKNLRSDYGERIRRGRLDVTGLTAGAANVIPHTLPGTPQRPNYVATSGTPGFETALPDSTNLYFTTGAGQTSMYVYVEY